MISEQDVLYLRLSGFENSHSYAAVSHDVEAWYKEYSDNVRISYSKVNNRFLVMDLTRPWSTTKSCAKVQEAVAYYLELVENPLIKE